MMLFSKSTEYSIKILLYLSKENFSSYLSAGNIASAVGLPKEYISKILQSLTHYGIVGSQKGKGGSFKLIKSPLKIRLIDLINAFENESFFTKCVIGLFSDCKECECPIHKKWETLKL
jgi:Rrf2 family protein